MSPPPVARKVYLVDKCFCMIPFTVSGPEPMYAHFLPIYAPWISLIIPVDVVIYQRFLSGQAFYNPSHYKCTTDFPKSIIWR